MANGRPQYPVLFSKIDSNSTTSDVSKLKYREIKPYRDSILLEQEHRCALCNDLIEDDAVLDHDHKTGRIRGVLHRGCNALLGKIENNLARNKMTAQRLHGFLANLEYYVEHAPQSILHPTHKVKPTKSKRKTTK